MYWHIMPGSDPAAVSKMFEAQKNIGSKKKGKEKKRKGKKKNLACLSSLRPTSSLLAPTSCPSGLPPALAAVEPLSEKQTNQKNNKKT